MTSFAGRILAEIVRWFHFAWVAFVILALPTAMFVPQSHTLIAVVVVGMLLTWVFIRDCPLRSLEHRLRMKFHPEGAHGEGFLYHYFGKPLGLSARAMERINWGWSLLIVFALLWS